MATTVKAIYLDVGGPLVDDSGLDEYWNEHLLRTLPGLIGREVTLEEIETANRQSIRSYTPSLYSGTIWRLVQPDKEKFKVLRADFDRLDHSQFFKLRPEAEEVLSELSKKYTLAIAANQPQSTADFLERHGIMKHFAFRQMSGELPYSKPDFRFFIYIADQLGIPLTESVMVGDRQDNDIAPAKRLRMRAVRYLTGSHREQEVRMPNEMPDCQITSLKELPRAINDLLS